jgi:hypothetical protein
MKENDIRELHYVVKYNMETRVWEIDWDSIESRFVDGNYYDSRGGWDLIEPEFENPVIKELEARLNND